MRPKLRWLFALTLGLVVSHAALADEAPKPRVDLAGNPLPRAAVSRLGSPRGVKLASDDFAAFSASGKHFVTRRQLWDVQSGKLVHDLRDRGRLILSPNGTPHSVTYADHLLTVNSLGVEPFGWEVNVSDTPSMSLATGHVLYQLQAKSDVLPKEPTKASSTNLRNVWTGLDVHRLAHERVGSAGRKPEPWRFGVSADGQQLAAVTRSLQIEHHLIGKENQRTTDSLEGLPGNNQIAMLFSPEGKYVVALPEHRQGRIQVVGTEKLEATAALRDVVPLGYDNARVGLAFLSDPPQLAVLRGGDSPNQPAILKVWNVATEGMTARTWIRDVDDLRRAVLWLASRGLCGDLPSGFVPLDDSQRTMPALQCRLASGLFESAAAISPSGELVAVADEFSVTVWETASGQMVERLQPESELVRRLVFSPDDRMLLVHCDNDTGLIFEAVAAAGGLRDRPAKLLWDDLAGDRAKGARQAMLEIARRGDEALRDLPADFPPKREREEIRRWIADLNSDDQAQRDAAQAKLYALGPLALPHLRETIRGTPSDEQIVRIRAILEHPAETVVDAAVLRGIRVVQGVAMLGSDSAIDALKRIAGGNHDPRITSRAAAALKRLESAKVGLGG